MANWSPLFKNINVKLRESQMQVARFRILLLDKNQNPKNSCTYWISTYMSTFFVEIITSYESVKAK